MIASLCIVISELIYIKHNIFSGNRQLGFVDLGTRISKSSIDSPIFYLQEVPHQFFEVDCEARLLMLVIRNNKPHYKVMQISDLNKMQVQNDEVYIVKSPFITKHGFEKMVDKQGLSFVEFLSVSATGSFEYMDDAFRVYIVKKREEKFM